MLKVLLFCLTIAIFLVCPIAIKACSCIYLTPEMAFNEAKSVFIGKAIKGTESTRTRYEGGSFESLSGDVDFQVDESFKGDTGKSLKLRVESNKGTSCGPYGIARNESYVVYVYEDDSGVLYTGVCTNTAHVGLAKGDVDYLRSLPARGSGGKITGYVMFGRTRHWPYSKPLNDIYSKLLGDIEVQVTGPDGKRHTVKSDSSGSFTFTGLPEGKYTLTADPPANRFREADTQVVTLSDRGTARANVWISSNSLITGKIVDQAGTIFDQALVTMESSGGRQFEGKSDGTGGAFTVDEVPAGKYKLYIEIFGFREGERKYYYPGTYKAEDAATIEVGESRSHSGLKFVLPPEFNIVKISGRVLRSDGFSASKAIVTLRCAKRANGDIFSIGKPSPTVVTGPRGSFSIDGLAGTTYELVAESEEGTKPLQSSPEKITMTASQANKELVLSKAGRPGVCAPEKD